MANNRYFVASDYDLTLHLQKLFHETVALHSKLDNAESKVERIELKLKLKESHIEISRLVKNMKYLLSDTELVESTVPLSLSDSKRNN